MSDTRPGETRRIPVRRASPPVGRCADLASCGTAHGRGRPCHGIGGAGFAVAAVAAALLLLTATLACAQIDLVSVVPLHVEFVGARVIDGLIVEPAPASPPRAWQVAAEGWAQVHHRWLAQSGSKLRQEIAVRPDRLEFTHIRLLQPDVTGVTSAGVLLPAALIDGVRAEFLGSPRPAEAATREGPAWSATLGREGVTSIRSLSYLRLHLPGGAVDFDCAPKGTWCPGEGVCPATPAWALLRRDDGWWLYSADGKVRPGGIHEFKLVMTPARPEPVAEVHPAVNVRWTNPYAPTVRLSFGAPVGGFEPCAFEGGSSTRDERFAGVQPERVEGVSVSGEASFVIPVERDGVYLVSLLVGDPEREIGPAEVFAGVGEPLRMPAVAAGDYDCWVAPGRCAQRAITVRLTGDFRLVAAQAAPMMFAVEDYLLDRDWWVSTQFDAADDLPL